MTISFDDFPAVQRAVRQVQQRVERAAGAAGQLLDQIGEEFGCKTPEQAREKLRALQEKRQAALARYNRKMVEFKRENADILKDAGIGEE